MSNVILSDTPRDLPLSPSNTTLAPLGKHQMFCRQVGEEELEQALTSAVTCCILASAGPQRSRVLANLYKDERCARLPGFPFLEKVYLERILRSQEVSGLGRCMVCSACLRSCITCRACSAPVLV